MSKGNDGTGNIEERDDWQTPQWLFDKLIAQYKISLDCCATNENTKCEAYCKDFLSKSKSDLKCENAWMNPPFSKARKMFEHFFNVVGRGICIYRCDNLETALWQDVILKHATWILIPKGRISYEGKAGRRSRFPSALIGFNVDMPKDVEGTKFVIQKSSEVQNDSPTR